VAKKTVVEIQCDRCPRREYLDGDAAKAHGPTVVTFAGNTIKYDDLCEACRVAEASHVEAIGKKLEGRSPERAAKLKEPAPEGAGPVNVVPVPPEATRPARPPGHAPR